MKAIDYFRRHPAEVQAKMFRRLMADGATTRFGQDHAVTAEISPEGFARQVEVQDYERFKPYIQRMLDGEENVSAPGRVRLFARSSGTTSDRSKFIPVTRESVWHNHTLGMRDVAAVYIMAHPHTEVFKGRRSPSVARAMRRRGR